MTKEEILEKLEELKPVFPNDSYYLLQDIVLRRVSDIGELTRPLVSSNNERLCFYMKVMGLSFKLACSRPMQGKYVEFRTTGKNDS